VLSTNALATATNSTVQGLDEMWVECDAVAAASLNVSAIGLGGSGVDAEVVVSHGALRDRVEAEESPQEQSHRYWVRWQLPRSKLARKVIRGFHFRLDGGIMFAFGFGAQ
jgi:hypothetical protein